MNLENNPAASSASRRNFMKTSTSLAAAAGLTSTLSRSVHAAEDNKIRVALIGCGGRGTGAAENALQVDNGEIELVAMADVFENRLSSSYSRLKENHPKKVDVPKERQFVSFDGYKQAMDTLRPGDVAILTTPPAFRWVMFKYAIEKGLNVFMEKPVTVDGPASRKMFELGKLSVERNLKVGVGLMCRHCIVRGELLDRIRNGEIGDLLMLRAYRMAGPTGSAAATKQPEDMKSELLYQLSRFHGFLWASGGAVSDFLIHNIDECCWMKEDWPVNAVASGGRHYRNDCVDQNFDTYSIEYTFADGTKMFVNGRTIPGCHNEFASYAHGTKGSAVISASGHSPAKCRIYQGQNMTRNNILWEGPKSEPNPYQLEWNDLINAIRKDMPYNEVERGVKASLVTSMGRMAAHTGVKVTYDEMLNCEHEFAPGLETMTFDSPAPVRANAQGIYPVPQPGILTTREYGDS
ncbi:MAG: Gfo/Idh/MocA family oxidoreductase [Planctomycetota bacterium]|jgi:predicted dehydrogenase|nr:Gfo/Idh/MocA family oxidoreductase [Planctomycetota bacterium]RLS74654.1 MAG: twin-arginine translocation signal domain-containing protein [Planctomycetota bacterium]RLS98489.1 MAG: twin-arginine translocation signal domain-containing protein [Planctomycetota bacterium]